MLHVRSALCALTTLVLSAGVLSACGGDDEEKLVIYNAQHEELVVEVVDAFTDETGIEVEMRNGSDLELANQLVAEGDASKADVFLTENSPAMSLVQAEGLFTTLEQGSLDNIPEQYRPDDDSWTGFAARSTVMVYNTERVQPDQLPASLLDLADPEWQGRISFSPTGADFQAIVAAVLALEGEEATAEWLAGLEANGTVYDGNNVVLESVNAGQTDAGVIYHYYWYRDQEEAGDNSDNSKLHFFGNQDPGAFLSISGAGVLKNGEHTDDAQEFVEFLTGPEGQEIVSDSYALEYPLNPEVDIRAVPPLEELEVPNVDVSDLDSEKVIELMQSAGLL
jgi:iron(III) transport system substrate-binding protein